MVVRAMPVRHVDTVLADACPVCCLYQLVALNGCPCAESGFRCLLRCHVATFLSRTLQVAIATPSACRAHRRPFRVRQ